MTYNASIPQATDDPTISQGQLLTNFGVLNTDFSVNHQPFTSGNNPGLHTQINFPIALSGDPGLTSPQSSIYPKTSGGNTQLFYQNDSSSSYPTVVQLTGLPIVTTTSGATGYGFQSPWGLIFNFGSLSAAFPATITFQVPYLNSPPVIVTAMLTNQALVIGNFAVITNITQTQMTYRSSSNCYFLVIGK